MPHKVLIADDHPIFRAGIKEIINSIATVQLVGEAVNGLDAYQGIVNNIPDIAILDLEMPLLTGLDVARKVTSEKHFTKFIILTMHKDRHFFEDAMACGVSGYLLKDHAIDELVKCIETVAAGGTYVSKDISHLLTGDSQAGQIPDELKQSLALLSPTEKVILKLVSQSKTSQEIADNIFISPNTVDNHRASIARKLKLEGKNSLLKFALHHKSIL